VITIRVNGTVEAQASHRDSGQDGRAEYAVENTLGLTVEVSARKEFTEGYVNLEGYVLSEHWTTEEDLFYSFEFGQNRALDGFTLLTHTADLTVSFHGGRYDWVQQAVRYVTERPNLSVVGALQKFQRWDETDNDVLTEAKQIAEAVDHTDHPVGGLGTGEYNTMLAQLENETKRDNDAKDLMQWAADSAGV